jgi:meso-butanediol dehydrogenase/(S,S)-butanediol dehydrogenase/diacetyl reductase
MGRLDGKIAVITGISGGQGRAAAIRFTKEGAIVAGCARNAENAAETARLVQEQTGRELDLAAPLDLTDNDAVVAWIDGIAERHGGIDILYNNAGEPKFGPVPEMALEDWHFTIHHELDIIYYASRAAWPHMVGRPGANFVNVASIAGLIGMRNQPQAAHGAAKQGVIGLTRQMAAEGAAVGLRANVISPGLIDTPATDWLIAMGPTGPLGPFMERLPLGRAGVSDEVVNAALFLASDEASYITGVNLLVDGGSSILQ